MSAKPSGQQESLSEVPRGCPRGYVLEPKVDGLGRDPVGLFWASSAPEYCLSSCHPSAATSWAPIAWKVLGSSALQTLHMEGCMRS